MMMMSLDRNMNKIYGFDGEIKHKYDNVVMSLFQEIFNWLPLAAVISNYSSISSDPPTVRSKPVKSVFVVHGGLSSNSPQVVPVGFSGAVPLSAIESLTRGREPPESGLMADLLWSDPHPMTGKIPSKVG